MKNNTITKHFIVGMITSVILLMTMVSQAHAMQVAGPSAALITPYAAPQPTDTRAKVLQAYLATKGSPMSDDAQTFIDEADRYKLDWKLVAAIAGNESGFGLAIPEGSYNAWGFGVYGSHVTYFGSWKDGIHQVSQSLRDDYMNKWGGTDVYSIGNRYAADPAWAIKVSHYMAEIDAFQKASEKPTLSISL